MNIVLKIFGALVVVGLVTFVINTNHEDDSSKEARRAAVGTSNDGGKKYFNIEDATLIEWKEPASFATLKKNDDKWEIIASSNPALLKRKLIDTWPVVQRLTILSRFNPKQAPTSQAANIVTISITTSDQKVYSGHYDYDHFQWDTSNETLVFNNDEKRIFGEGIRAFESHDITLCDPKNVTGLKIEDSWSVSYDTEKQKWLTSKKLQTEPARATALSDLFTQFCQIHVDAFVSDPQSKTAFQPALIITYKSKGKSEAANRHPNTLSFSKADSIYASHTLGTFISANLNELLKLPWENVKDASTDQARIALDQNVDTPERVKAINKMKELASPEGIPALKTLVNENTDIDVYRYPAVDALAAIGTKEAFQIIAERLGQVTRSGFQLRLARALGTAMARPFLADEKTPDDVREKEVVDLLQAYKKKPIGK